VTVRSCKEQLSSLDIVMKNQGSDIEKFNQEASHVLAALSSSGAWALDDDLIPQLLKGHKKCTDKEFVCCVKDIQHQCGRETEDTPNPLTAHGTVDDANTFCTAREEGKEWSAPTDEDEKIVALQSLVNKLQQQRQKQPSDVSNKNKKGKQSKDKNGKDKSCSNNDGGNECSAWMLKQPGLNEAHTKDVNGKTCHCCPVHGCWVRHAPSDCNLKKQKDKNEDKGQEPHDQGKPKLQLAEALNAIIESNE